MTKNSNISISGLGKKQMIYGHFMVMHFFAICTFIFDKAEVQMVILRCLMTLNFIWFKTYGPRCSLRPRMSLVNSQKLATDKWPFYNHIGPLVRKLWHKNQKMQKMQMCVFVQILKKNWNGKNGNILVFCHNYWTNYNLDPFTTSK